MNETVTRGPIEGYLQIEPKVTVEGDVATIDAQSVYYKNMNEAVRQAFANGMKTVRLLNVNGQRYIGTGLRTDDLRIEVRGTPGQAVAMFMDGPDVEVHGNVQDGAGNTMNAGSLIVHGGAGDVVGYGMRGGRLFIRGDVGYRAGIHMKAHEGAHPVIVAGGSARDFLGEYMAGGLLILLGLGQPLPGVVPASVAGSPGFAPATVVGTHIGAGMHGGEIYVRGEVEPWRCGDEVHVAPATAPEVDRLRDVLHDYCQVFGIDGDQLFALPFTRIVPAGRRPYAGLSTYL
jgi:glutamate synthase domain-containing protein 3